MIFDLREAVTNRRRDLRELCEQRKIIEMLIVQAHLALSSLEPEIEDKKEREEVLREIAAARRKPAGLTKTISENLRQTPYQSLSANEVRHWLEREGFDLSDYSQPLATISVALRRLEKRGRVKATRDRRKVTYKWIWDDSGDS